MRRYALLAMTLAMPAIAMAQGSKEPAEAAAPKEKRQSLRDQLNLDQLGPDSEAAPAKEEQDAVDDKLPLGAKLYLTNNPAGFQKAWKDNADALPTAERIGPANPVMAMVLVSGCKRGKDGKCNLTFTSRTAGPDGQFDKPNTSPPWKPSPMGKRQELAPSSFGLRLGPGDPAGRYTVEVTVNDLVAKAQRTVKASVNKPAADGGR